RFGDLVGAAAVDDAAGFAVQHGFRCTTRHSGDHGDSAGGGLEVDDAETFDVEAGAAGAGGHGENICDGVVGGEFGCGDPAGEHDIVAEAECVGEPAQPVFV